MHKKQKVLVMSIVLLGYFIILVDTSLVFTCSKEIAQSFIMDSNMSAWISNAYALTFGSLLLLGGKLGDIYGRRLIFIGGLILFGMSSLAVGLSTSVLMLISFRAIQGVGAAIIAPATLAIIMDYFEGNERVFAISIYGAMSGIGVSVGLIIGAGVTTILSWRWGFLVNVPITMILIVMSLRILKKGSIRRQSTDILGALTSFFAIVFIINGISGIGSHVISLGAGLLLLVYFIYHEADYEQPLMPLKLFNSVNRSFAYVIRFLYSGAITGFWFFTPLFLQASYKMTPLMVGISFLPMTIANFFSAETVSYFTKKLGTIKLLILGLIITTIGFAGLIFLKGNQNYWGNVALPMLIIGLGQGIVLSPVTNLAVENTPTEVSGVSSSLINVMLQIGGAFGLATLSNISRHLIGFQRTFHVQSIGFTIFSGFALILAIILGVFNLNNS